MDDSERRIDVSYTESVRDWQTALDVAVPAHVVGEMALGVEDPMEAKQAVIDGDLPEGLTVGSGPFLVTAVEGTETATNLTLEVNRAYEGDTPPSHERIEVVAGDAPLDGFPDDLDFVQIDPTPDNFVAVRDLERCDHHGRRRTPDSSGDDDLVGAAEVVVDADELWSPEPDLPDTGPALRLLDQARSLGSVFRE